MNSARSQAYLSIAALLAMCVAAAAAPAVPAAPPPAATHIRSIEGVAEYRLANGLQVLLYPDEASTTFSVNVTYNVGSRHESYGETGMAHLLEHMNFKGTPKHRDIPAEIASHGARANATTAYDRTNYFETLDASAANLEWALGLEADRMTHSFIAKKDLDSEMTVVRNEFESGENSPARVLEERVLSTAYLWHNYGHSTIGSRADIEGVPIERLQRFYHTYYQPDNATLIVTGKFDQKATLNLIERLFGAIPKPTRILPLVYTAEPPQDGERDVTLRRTGGQEILMEAFHVPADAHPDAVPLGILADLLNERPSGLLYKKLVESKLAVSAAMEVETLHDPGFLIISVTMPKDGDLVAVRKVLDEVRHSVMTQTFVKEELERVRDNQVNGYERLLNASPQVASVLSENVAVGDWRLLFWDRDQMRKVTAEDVKRVANTYLIDSNLTVGTFVPDDKPVRAIIAAAPNLNTLLEGYTGQAAVADGEHFAATPENIESRVKRGVAGSMKTAFLIKKSRGEHVTGVIDLHLGSVASLQNKADAGNFTAALLMRGTAIHARQQLQDELTRLDARMSVQGGANGVSLSFDTTQANLAAVLQLAGEVLKQPAFPSGDFEELKRDSLAKIDTARTEPNSIAGLALRRSLSPYRPGDFRYVQTLDEHAASLSAVTVEDVKSFHRQFYGANNAEAALVGNFDGAAVAQQLTELFGSWQSATAYERAVALYKPVSADTQVFATPDKANAIFLVGENLKLKDSDPNYAALELANAMLGGGFLNSRLATRIRQKEGLSYSVGTQLNAGSQDPVGGFTVFAIYAPQNAGKVETAAKEEVARALADGFTPAEITDAKSGLLQSLSVSRSTDAQLANQLADHLHLQRDFTWDAQFEKAIESAGPDLIHQALQHFIDPAQWVIVKAGDFAKGAG